MSQKDPLFSPSSSPRNDASPPPKKSKHYISSSMHATPYIGSADTKSSPSPSNFVQPTIELRQSTRLTQAHPAANYDCSPVRVLFKSGYEQQEEIRHLRRENQELKDQLSRMREQLDKYKHHEEVFKENARLREEIKKMRN